jgi:glycine betaine transporter
VSAPLVDELFAAQPKLVGPLQGLWSAHEPQPGDEVQTILSIAIIITLATSLAIVLRFGTLRCEGTMPVSLFTFMAILFTSGLDVGLIMFPLTEFPTYASEEPYAFANPLAIEFGFWGFLVWGFYFLTSFYFVVVEPKLQLFEIPAVKIVNNIVIMGTCAFTAYLFLTYLPNYIAGISEPARFGLVALVVLLSVLSSTDIRYVKVRSIASTWMFFALIIGMWATSGMGATGFASSIAGVGEYFTNLHRFVTPITDYHAFHLFWWFSWSIMIGQFVARFVGGLPAWQLLIAMLVLPSIPLAVWFAVLYFHYAQNVEIIAFFRLAMVAVGIVFVINSLDSLIRLYTTNLDLTVESYGKPLYIAGNFVAMFGLVLLYQFTPLKIEWIGLVVIGLYAAIYTLLFLRRHELLGPSAPNSTKVAEGS